MIKFLEIFSKSIDKKGTVSMEEYNNARKAIGQLQEDLVFIRKTIELVTDENERLKKENEELQKQRHKDIVAALHDFSYFADKVDEKAKSIDVFERSGMTYDEINRHMYQLQRHQELRVERKDHIGKYDYIF